MHVPYPPWGYWAKKGAGKAVTVETLPPRPAHIPDEVEIRPSPQSPELPPAARAALAAAALSASTVTIPEKLEKLHTHVEGG
jgi:hypothetical protein